MKITKTCALFACVFPATAACSWVVPHDLEDGFYTVSFPDQDILDSGIDGNATRPPIVKRHNPLVKRIERSSGDQVPADGGTGFDPFPEDLSTLQTEAPARDPPKLRPADAKPPQMAGMVPMPVSSYDCFFGVRRLVPHEYAQARQSLFHYCDSFLVGPNMRHISVYKSRGAVAYVCNWHKGKDRHEECSTREYKWAEENWFDIRCGKMRPAWVEMKNWKKRYGRGYLGMEICADKDGMKASVWEGPSRQLPPLASGKDRWGYARKNAGPKEDDGEEEGNQVTRKG